MNWWIDETPPIEGDSEVTTHYQKREVTQELFDQYKHRSNIPLSTPSGALVSARIIQPERETFILGGPPKYYLHIEWEE